MNSQHQHPDALPLTMKREDIRDTDTLLVVRYLTEETDDKGTTGFIAIGMCESSAAPNEPVKNQNPDTANLCAAAMIRMATENPDLYQEVLRRTSKEVLQKTTTVKDSGGGEKTDSQGAPEEKA